jgi:hypothetical protein
MITISFLLGVSIICPTRSECTSTRQRRRQITVQPRYLHQALQEARVEQDTDTWKTVYRARAGIEAPSARRSPSPASATPGSTDLDKVKLEHPFADTGAVSLIRMRAWWAETPLQRTRIAHLGRRSFTLTRLTEFWSPVQEYGSVAEGL